jgi:ankyrin repeat protein
MDHTQNVLRAAANGDIQILRDLLRSTSPAVVRAADDPNEFTALHLAAAGGNVDVVRFLLSEEIGADATAARGNNFTPLHSAAMYGHTSVCELLIDAGADPNIQTDPQGYAPLHSASFGGHVDTVRLLISRNADTTLRNYRDELPIETARRQQQHEVIAAITELTT